MAPSNVRFERQKPHRRQAPFGLEAGRSDLERHDRWQAGRGAGADDPNGFALSYRGVETQSLCLHRARGRLCAADAAKKDADTGKQILCPMPGLVVSIAVKEGQEVKAGETVAVVEAMKMENVLRAEIDGTVKKINAKPGDSLAVDAVILEFS